MTTARTAVVAALRDWRSVSEIVRTTGLRRDQVEAVLDELMVEQRLEQNLIYDSAGTWGGTAWRVVREAEPAADEFSF